MDSIQQRVLTVVTIECDVSGISSAQQLAPDSGTDPSDFRKKPAENRPRKKWQSAGRKIRGANSADLRAHAVRQKLKMRLLPSAKSAMTPGAWNSVGPSALPSDASGAGLQGLWIRLRPGHGSRHRCQRPQRQHDFRRRRLRRSMEVDKCGRSQPDPVFHTWLPLTDNQATLSIGSIAVQPQLSNPNPATSVILAGTGETDSSADSYYGLGILRSGDGGQTWTLIRRTAPAHIPLPVSVSVRSHSAPLIRAWR